jgi:hypothetical protein
MALTELEQDLIERLKTRIQDLGKLHDNTDDWELEHFKIETASSVKLDAMEEELGFKLPALARALYEQVCDGGFGPGYGLYSIDEGRKGMVFGEIMVIYRQCIEKKFYGEWNPKHLRFCTDGGLDDFILDCSTDTGRILWWDGLTKPARAGLDAETLYERLNKWLATRG